MKKTLKRISITLGILIGIIVLFIAISYINHRVKLSKEDQLIAPLGQLVEVNGHKLNVYTEGQGDVTLVFMSGGGTCSPILDFKSLYSLLSKKYRIVVIEKSGYGFSEISNTARDIDTVLFETREALAQAGISGKFILCPHSMSGIEALYWKQLYPNEINAIVGLDMAVPQSYEQYRINMPLIKLGAFGANTGVTRWFPNIAEDSAAIKYGSLSNEEIELHKMIFYRRTATKSMLGEVKEIKKSAHKVAEIGIPSVPILLFSSNGQGTGWTKDQWRKCQKDFIQNNDNCKLIELDCSHYVHNIEYNLIANEIESFIDSLNE